MVLVFEGHFLDLERRELRRDGALITLEPQVFDLLVYLVLRRDRVVGKDELFEAIWSGRIVSDSALSTRINAVRRAIGDDGASQRLIRTFRRKGFRFVGQVKDTTDAQEVSGAEAASGAKLSLSASAFADRASVVILPFDGITGDPEERWFADGLVEDAVTALSRFRWLTVLAPISHLASQGKELRDIRIGCELGVRYLVQGAVRRSGRQLRISAHLTDAGTGSILWTDRFDGVIEDGFGLQDNVASIMAGSIEANLQSAEARRCNTRPNAGATPYDFHLQAHPIFSSDKESVLRSLGLIERAITLDPNYGAAWADAANCLQILDVNGWTGDRLSNREKAVNFARKALHASSDAEVVAISAFVLAYFGEDTDAAAALMENSLRVNPNFVKGWYMSGMMRLYSGQPEEAIERFETSIRLNPRDRTARRSTAGIGFAQLFDRQFDKAVPILRPVLQEFPRWATPYCVLASCYAHLGFSHESEGVARRLKATAAVPKTAQFRDAKHRELLTPGLKLSGAD